MGLYLNPLHESKEAFLERHGRPIKESEFKNWDFLKKDELPVVWVNNGPFTAAAVAYDEGELRAFTEHKDPRPKSYFAVPFALIITTEATGLPEDAIRHYIYW